MSSRAPFWSLALLLVCSAPAWAQQDTVTRTIRKPVCETRWEEREETVYRERLTTETQDVKRYVTVPVTEYRWEAFWVNRFNPFAPAYLAYRYVPRTRLETRTEIVRAPVTRREFVPQKVVRRIPITVRRFEEVAVTEPATTARAGDPFNGTATARTERYGGIAQLPNDPPRRGSAWRPSPGALWRY